MIGPFLLLTTLAHAGDLPSPPPGIPLLPPEAACLEAPRTPLGLADVSVAEALATIQDGLNRCLAGSSGSLEADVRVGCGGHVQDVVAYHGGELMPDVAACVMDALYYAPFPAHDAVDGVWVTLEVRPRSTVAAPVRPAIADLAPQSVAEITEAAACSDQGVRDRCDAGDREACAALAMAILCFWPPLSSEPLAPANVSLNK